MKNIQNFNNFNLIKEEASPRLRRLLVEERRWKKKVAIYLHDDMDGILLQ
jgi:hypothetical protein